MSDRLPVRHEELETPFLAIDVACLSHVLGELAGLAAASGVSPLFAPKACSIPFVLKEICGVVDGFACSSLNELRLVHDIRPSTKLHFTTPGIRPDELKRLVDLSNYLTLNSLTQWLRFVPTIKGNTSLGIRVNPKLSLVRDARYDPCRESSKLAVPVEVLAARFASDKKVFEDLTGLHFHTNCDSTDVAALLATGRHVEDQLSDVLEQIDWINLGGGYLFDECDDLAPFYETVDLFRRKYGLRVFIEPGASIVRKSGFLVSRVIDKFVSDFKEVLVLDTTVNHMPEVLEYNYQPVVANNTAGGPYEYLLVGCTCLAGDLFGEYSFLEELQIGSSVVFEEVGAYTLVRAHRFNGVELPSIYKVFSNGDMELQRKYDFDDFASFYGVDANENV